MTEKFNKLNTLSLVFTLAFSTLDFVIMGMEFPERASYYSTMVSVIKYEL